MQTVMKKVLIQKADEVSTTGRSYSRAVLQEAVSQLKHPIVLGLSRGVDNLPKGHKEYNAVDPDIASHYAMNLHVDEEGLKGDIVILPSAVGRRLLASEKHSKMVFAMRALVKQSQDGTITWCQIIAIDAVHEAKDLAAWFGSLPTPPTE